MELADGLASADNPLTARVIVNRVWLWMFGRGLVETVDNFGNSGATPSHPELLDFLAERFVREGWSIKRLVREIALSHTYRLASTYDEASFTADPENRWLWRHTSRRLEAEEIRDAMLTVAGRLDLQPPVGSLIGHGNDGLIGGGPQVAAISELQITEADSNRAFALSAAAAERPAEYPGDLRPARRIDGTKCARGHERAEPGLVPAQ